jgi:hypothetical protein
MKINTPSADAATPLQRGSSGLLRKLAKTIVEIITFFRLYKEEAHKSKI